MFGRLIKRRAATASLPAGSVISGRKSTLEPSVIASNVNVLGNMVSDGVLDIDGQVDGNVTAQHVTLRPNGRIRGDLIAVEAIVHGTVDGLIKAQAVSLFATAVVNGTIMHETLMIEDGASVNGKLKRTEIRVHNGEVSVGSSAALGTTPVDSASSRYAEMSSAPAGLEDMFYDDNGDEPVSEKEMKILENLKLISD